MRTSRKIKITVFSLIGISIAAIITVFIGYRSFMGDSRPFLALVPGNASVLIDHVRHTAIKDNAEKFQLKAESAQVIENNKKTKFESLSVVIFLDDGGQVHLSALEGILENRSNDMRVSGNVVATKERYRLDTEEMHYKHDEQLIRSPGTATIRGDTFTFTADTMTYDLKSDKIRMEGHVKGTIDETLAL